MFSIQSQKCEWFLNWGHFCFKGGIIMIKKATVVDRERLLALANEAPSENLFIIGDIETYGFDKDYQEIWYEEIDGKMEGIYLK